MSRLTQQLLILVAILFITSIGVYWIDNNISIETSIKGRDFLVGFNVDQIGKIELRKKDFYLSFVREGDHFIIENFYRYPVPPEKVNELLYKMASLTIAEKITDDSTRYDELGVVKNRADLIVDYFGKSGERSGGFIVGNNYKGQGQYVLNSSEKSVYLTASPLYVSVNKTSYIENNLFRGIPGTLSSVEVNNSSKGERWSIERVGEKWILKPQLNKGDPEKISRFVTDLSRPEVLDYFPIQSPTPIEEIKDLSFSYQMTLNYDDHSSYQLHFAEKKDNYYLKTLASTTEIDKKLELAKEATLEQVQEVANSVNSTQSVRRYNLKHGVWIYKISKQEWSKFVKTLKEFSSSR